MSKGSNDSIKLFRTIEQSFVVCHRVSLKKIIRVVIGKLSIDKVKNIFFFQKKKRFSTKFSSFIYWNECEYIISLKYTIGFEIYISPVKIFIYVTRGNIQICDNVLTLNEFNDFPFRTK